jgi:VWFA-related protein
MRRRREEEARRRRDPNGDPTETLPERRDPNFPGTTSPSSSRPGRGEDDSIKAMLDMAYLTADGYLRALAEKSGGRLLRADTLKSLPDAFGQIAAELRTQYMLGYYPLNKERDDRYRKIKVTTTRKHVVIRARPGYLATNAK